MNIAVKAPTRRKARVEWSSGFPQHSSSLVSSSHFCSARSLQDSAALRTSECVAWSTAIVAGFALESFYSLFCDDGHHDEGRHRVGPPQTKKGIE